MGSKGGGSPSRNPPSKPYSYRCLAETPQLSRGYDNSCWFISPKPQPAPSLSPSRLKETTIEAQFYVLFVMAAGHVLG